MDQRFRLRIIGLSGKAGVGKDYIIQKYFRPQRFFQINLAWHFKNWLIGQKKLTYEEVYGDQKSSHVRNMLQQEGTERGRDVYGQDIWLDTLYAWMRTFQDAWGIDNFVIGDVRFINEVKKIYTWGGVVGRIVAPKRNELFGPVGSALRGHSSESELDEYTNYTAYLHNDIGDDILKLEQEIGELITKSKQ